MTDAVDRKRHLTRADTYAPYIGFGCRTPEAVLALISELNWMKESRAIMAASGKLSSPAYCPLVFSVRNVSESRDFGKRYLPA
jgi:hypothetical protein